MTKARAVRVAAIGAPDVMKIETSDLAAPAAGEAQIRQTAIGFNYLDISQRAGAMPLPLPTVSVMRRPAWSKQLATASPAPR